MPTSRARRLCPDGVLIPPDFTAYREASRGGHGPRPRGARTGRGPRARRGVSRPRGDRGAAGRDAAPRRWRSGRPRDWAPRSASGPTGSWPRSPRMRRSRVGSWSLTREEACARFAGSPPRADSRDRPEDRREAARAGDHDARSAGRGDRRDARRRRSGATRARPAAPGAVRGIGRGRPVREAVSESRETTFDVDLADRAEMEAKLRELAVQLCERLAKGERRGRTIAIKVRLDDFTTLTRARTLPRRPNDAAVGPEVAARPAARLRTAAARAAARGARGGVPARRDRSPRPRARSWRWRLSARPRCARAP